MRTLSKEQPGPGLNLSLSNQRMRTEANIMVGVDIFLNKIQQREVINPIKATTKTLCQSILRSITILIIE